MQSHYPQPGISTARCSAQLALKMGEMMADRIARSRRAELAMTRSPLVPGGIAEPPKQHDRSAGSQESFVAGATHGSPAARPVLCRCCSMVLPAPPPREGFLQKETTRKAAGVYAQRCYGTQAAVHPWTFGAGKLDRLYTAVGHFDVGSCMFCRGDPFESGNGREACFSDN